MAQLPKAMTFFSEGTHQQEDVSPGGLSQDNLRHPQSQG